MVDERTRQEIDAETEQLKDAIVAIGEQARESAWVVEQHGLMVNGDKTALTYGGKADWYHAVSYHPVWGEEIRDAIRMERNAGVETGPLGPQEYEARWLAVERWCDEVLVERQARGEIPPYVLRGSWEAHVIREATEPVALRGDGVTQTQTLPVADVPPRDRIRATMAAAAQRAPTVVQEQEPLTYGR
jgi:hypothetical protein